VSSPLLSLPEMAADRDRIEAAMHDAVVTSDQYLTEIASHLIVAGGKRLRPVIAVTAGRLAGGEASDDVVRGGVACELVHLGSLYHDDVMDEAETRRGVETVNARWGNLQAILAGDFLLSRASEIAASLGTEVAGLLARTIGWLCEGQIEELRHTYDTDRTEESYFASIHGKTASLYGTAARIGGIVAGLDRATIDALREYPHLNASVGENELVVHNYVNLGIAVDLDFQGLLAPVVRDADGKRMRSIARDVVDLATRARSKQLSPDELSGGTFTLTNAGSYGTMMQFPIINQPQVAILSTDGVKRKPVVIEDDYGNESIAIHSVGVLAMAWDHRAIDGAYAAAFLARTKEIIETRDWDAELA